VGVRVFVGLGVFVGTGVWVDVGVKVNVGLGVFVGTGVWVDVGVKVSVGLGVVVGFGVVVAIDIGCGWLPQAVKLSRRKIAIPIRRRNFFTLSTSTLTYCRPTARLKPRGGCDASPASADLFARVSPPLTGGDSRVGLEAMLVECNCAGARNVLSWFPSRTGTLRGHGA